MNIQRGGGPDNQGQITFAVFPGIIARCPPDWKPATLTMAGALCALGRLKLGEDIHPVALQSGAKRLARERKELKDKFNENGRIDDEYHPKGGMRERDVNDYMQKQGGSGYKIKHKKLRKQPVESVTIAPPSLNWLLTQAHLSDGTKNRETLKDAFVSLSRSLTLTLSNGERKHFPALIKHYDFSNYEIVLDGSWLQFGDFERVPLPMPTHSPVAMRLWLYLRTIRTQRTNTKGNVWKGLARRLGIATRVAWRIKQTIHRALAIVNAYLGTFDDETRKAFKMPFGYHLIDMNGKLRFERYEQPVRVRAEFKRKPIERLTPKRENPVMLEPQQQPIASGPTREEVKQWSKNERERGRREAEQAAQTPQEPQVFRLRGVRKYGHNNFIRLEVNRVEATQAEVNDLIERHRKGEIKLICEKDFVEMTPEEEAYVASQSWREGQYREDDNDNNQYISLGVPDFDFDPNEANKSGKARRHDARKAP
jgi:hypothetical protein